MKNIVLQLIKREIMRRLSKYVLILRIIFHIAMMLYLHQEYQHRGVCSAIATYAERKPIKENKGHIVFVHVHVVLFRFCL